MMREALPPRERENVDPEEQVRPIPRPLIALLLAGMLWGAWYLATSATGVSPMLGDARTAAGFAAASPSDQVDGAQVYAGKCAACHQASGLGVAGVFPPLAQSQWVTGSEARLIQILLHGIVGPITVLGTEYNGAMPAWNALSDAELAAVASYIRVSFGNQVGEITVARVAAERAASVGRTAPWAGGAELETLSP